MTRSNLALSFHRIHDRVFELSGLRTGSVRDQALRAVLITEGLHAHGLVSEAAPLLVVGGGAAGIAATRTASELNVPSLLIEREPSVLTTQQAVPTRYIDPTEYDWPHEHWSCGRFPFRPHDQPLPMPFERGRARDLSWDWLHDFNNWRTSFVNAAPGVYAPIHLLLAHEAVPSASGDGLDLLDRRPHGQGAAVGTLHWDAQGVYLRGSAAAGVPADFGAVLSCTGFGRESRDLPSSSGHYQGPAFWAEDFLEARDLGLPASTARRDVLVSGGGDGAMQDVQRLLTRLCGRDLFDAICDVDPGFPSRPNLARLALADDEGRRAHAWAAAARRPLAALRRWHQCYRDESDLIWARWTDSQRSDLAARLMRDSLNIHLTWVVGDLAPSYCFGLNRLLTHLVLRLHEHQTGRPFWTTDPSALAGERPIVVAGPRLTHVQPSQHVCKDAAGCYGRLHRAYCALDGQVTDLGEFDIVVVRHGMQVQPLFGAAPVAEQATPFAFPE